MKRFVVFIIIGLLAAGCRSFDVIVKDDPFKGSTIVTADMWHKVTDAKIDNRRALYKKEIVRGKVSNPTVSFEFGAQIIPIIGYQGAPLGNDVYILCDAKNFMVKLIDNNKVMQTQIGSGQSINVQMTNICTLTGRITLTPDIQKAIQNRQNYQISFNIGNDNLTLKATPAQLDAVKKFIATNTPDAGKKEIK